MQRFSGDAVLAVLVAAYFVAGLIALLSPRVPAPPHAAEKFGLKKAFADPTLRRALIAGTLTLGAHGVFYTFGTLYWQSKGFSGGLIGALWAYSVAVEVTLFGVVKRLLPQLGRAPLHPGRSASAALVRWSLFPFATEPVAAFALQTLHGATFGMTHLGIMMAIGAVSTPGHTARLQAAYQFCHGSMMAAAMVAAGPLFRLSPTVAFLCRGGRRASRRCISRTACRAGFSPRAPARAARPRRRNRRGRARGPWRGSSGPSRSTKSASCASSIAGAMASEVREHAADHDAKIAAARLAHAGRAPRSARRPCRA